MKQFLRNAKWCFTGRKQIKNWLPLLFEGVDGLHVAKLDNLNVLFRGGTDDLSLLVNIFTFRNYRKYFPFNEKAIIIDIGAHNGYLSLWACANTIEGSMIFAYEPAPDNYEIARANAQNNNIRNLIHIGLDGEKMLVAQQQDQIIFSRCAGAFDVLGIIALFAQQRIIIILNFRILLLAGIGC